MNNLSKIKTEIKNYANELNVTELQVIEKLENYYFNKKLNKNLNLYKKRKKKVREITKDLKISSRKFYAILENKNIEHKKYNKSNEILINE
jgi:tRNA(Met) C34 N-acetyltransferase TmcA